MSLKFLMSCCSFVLLRGERLFANSLSFSVSRTVKKKTKSTITEWRRSVGKLRRNLARLLRIPEARLLMKLLDATVICVVNV